MFIACNSLQKCYNVAMNEQTKITGSLRLTKETWAKLRELMRFYGGQNKSKTAWFSDWVNKQHANMEGKK